ncbi:MAG: hypothetical protein P4L41_11330 [Flavipsychrobacter sp.]|nr:hypothetical protein [Flavipsychrobacter sp.]
MKRILFCCCIAIMPFQASFAQEATTVTQAVSEKALFSSRINEMDTYLGRQNEAKAKTVFLQLNKNMTDHLINSKNNLGSQPQAATAATYAKEQKLYLDILTLSKNLLGNRTEIYNRLMEYYSIY